jgi:pimeloyl-ACP methyl ester carboxylesterase
MLHPESVERLVVLNVAHPLVYSTQRRRLSYRLLTLAFEAPRALDLVSRATRFAPSRLVLRYDPVRPSSPDLVAEYVEAWRQPRATATSLAKDRAERRHRHRVPAMVRPVSCPVMTIWGDQDSYWGADGAHPPHDLASDVRVEHLLRQRIGSSMTKHSASPSFFSTSSRRCRPHLPAAGAAFERPCRSR